MNNNEILLQSKITKLEEENKQLREKISLYETNNEANNSLHLSKNEKLFLYCSYFKGRQDVVAQRYFSKKNNRYGYSPLCKNDFKQGICLKCTEKKVNCIKCTNKDFIGFSDELLCQHFLGNGRQGNSFFLGIYPLLKDGTCMFLAIDFDNNNYFNDMMSVYKIAIKYNLQPLLERSQSGNGGHFWLFFDEPVKATQARKLGVFLLKEAMKLNQTIKLASFDRMFPNQDYVTNDGLGNLIALPLQSNAYQQGNSAFIDTYNNVINNPIEYLSTIRKSTISEINEILQWDQDEDYFFEKEQLLIPLYENTKYDRKLDIIESNLLFINKQNLNALSINMIRRVASMYNPDYFLKQRLHKPIYNTTKTLCEYVEDDHYIGIPRGCKDRLQKVFLGTKISIDNRCMKGSVIDVAFNGELSEQQQVAVNTLMKNEQGVLQATAGFGKTVMALNIISRRKCNTLIIVNTKKLVTQWVKEINKFLDYPKSEKKKDSYIGVFTGTKKDLKYHLDVATAASLANNENLDDLISSYGMVIVDECHHIPSQSFRIIFRQIRALYIYGLSATPQRQDGLEKLIYMYCGEKRYETNKKFIISQRTFQQILIPRFMNTKSLDKDITYQALIDEIAQNENRNYVIANDIIKAYKNGRKIIVLSERISHLKVLYEKIRSVSPNVFLYLGDLKQKERNSIEKEISELNENENFIILATSKLLGEGFNLPRLDTLFLTLPIADKNRIEQYTGRIHREFYDKKTVLVYDYVDVHIPIFDSMFQKRLKAYYKEGYHLQEAEKVQELASIIYQNNEYLDVLKNDFVSAKKQLIIRMNIYHLEEIKKMHALLQTISQNGIKIIVINANDNFDEECRKYVLGAGCDIYESTHMMTSNYIVVDQHIVWYGNLNVFGNIKKAASMIRLDNRDFAQELLDNI
ncbi:MAG: DEAD/DEAH box helicase family protein [Erysipelotrichaceae bacterium]